MIIQYVKPHKKCGIPGINPPDVQISSSAEASTTAVIIDRITDVNQEPYYVDTSDDDTIRFLLDCAERGQIRDNERKPSICKVSRILRDHSESSYEPQLVSIGPIHREDPKLQEFEWLKECYLHDLLRRCDSTPMKTILEACLLKVNTLIPNIRESYAGVMKSYSDVELARMMVMDGCFILEFCLKHEDQDLCLPNTMQNRRIAMDLMLLENQVPFFVLQALFDCILGKESSTLSKVLDVFLACYFMIFHHHKEIIAHPQTTIHSDSDSTHDHDHVLGYLHKCYQLGSNLQHDDLLKRVKRAAKSPSPTGNEAFHSIVELDRSGMNFKPHQADQWSMTIKFQSSRFACLPWFKPTLLMPTLVIDDDTELILRNFIAYEQSFPQDRYYFTSYAHAMDRLIDSQEDIAKLVESKVLDNMLGSNQEAADMINNISKNTIATEFHYNQEFKEIDKYYNAFWPKHMAWLRRVYFNNPWNSIALLAAIILFALTVVQTVYAIIGK